MRDLEIYLTHCYDLLLNKKESHDIGTEDEERCVCANLIEYQDSSLSE